MERGPEYTVPFSSKWEIRVTDSKFVFDAPHYDSLNRAREDFLRILLPIIRSQAPLKSAADVGCGLGYFSSFLMSEGLNVSGLDGRRENVEEAKRRAPGVNFQLANVEDQSVQGLGPFDLVLCLGLLYHLENPFQAVRNLHALTGSVLIVAGMCIPDPRPILFLQDECPSEDQGLQHVAFYPSEACLIKLLYRSGFPFVYTLTKGPAHPDFHASGLRKRVRTMLVASRKPIVSELLALASDYKSFEDLWRTPQTAAREFVGRLATFASKPVHHQAATLWRLIKPKQFRRN